MIRLTLISFFTVSCIFAYQQYSLAACNTTGMTAGGGDVVVCDTTAPNPETTGVSTDPANPSEVTVQDGAGINTNTGNAITTGNDRDLINISGSQGPDDIIRSGDTTAINTNSGDDEVNIDGKLVRSEMFNAINLSNGNDLLNITNSTVEAPDGSGFGLSNGHDIVNVDGSTITSFFSPNLSNGDDTVTLTNSVFTTTSPSPGIDLGIGNDSITVENTIINGGPGDRSIQAASNDDTITLKNGADLRGRIDCASGFDTMIFEIGVPEEAVGFISSQILSSNPASGSITINGLFYEWVNCELLVPQLNGVPVVRPIPTLSQWGLIAMAGILGIVGIIAVRRKYAAI